MAVLTDAKLLGAELREAKLRRVHLSGADLFGADLTNAKGWTEEQLTAARSLEGATMPTGQKYEDWLKSSEEDRQGG